MLSRIDIEKELGKQINIFPLNFKHFKENSINLCVGRYAWSLKSGDIYFDPKREKFSLTQEKGFLPVAISKGESAIHRNGSRYYVALLPHSTTLIETKEVLAIGSRIGGTYHSKVGMVSQGLGHIGTMLGPNFSGNSLIAIHNISDDVITLNGGESFVSVVFHYLDTPVLEKNGTVPGHVDKMAELGIHLTTKEREELAADWCGKIEAVRDKMLESEEYKIFRRKQVNKKLAQLKVYLTWKNTIKALLLLAIFIGGYIWSNKADAAAGTTRWMDLYINVFISGFVITVVGTIITSFSKSK